ncbi:TetR family transcriptional regulator [Streptosporangium sp. NPDC049046]|uniref:TetR family transcriptional regulator n=1 Tax=Streptosporangium sp. NPDC049046 TaxID=3155031 RepID=UPI0034492CAC
MRTAHRLQHHVERLAYLSQAGQADDDLMGAERGEGDLLGAGAKGQLHRVAAHGAGGAGDQHPLAQHGAHISLDQIAAHAQVGKGTVFRRFGSRTGLMQAFL